MGMLDTFEGVCPACGKNFTAQTKLTDCTMTTLRVGSRVRLDDCRLEVKDPCACGLHPVVVIVDGRVVAFTKDSPTTREGPWGSLLEIGEDRRQAVDEINSAFMDVVKRLQS